MHKCGCEHRRIRLDSVIKIRCTVILFSNQFILILIFLNLDFSYKKCDKTFYELTDDIPYVALQGQPQYHPTKL